MGRLIDADKLILHLNEYALQEAPFGCNDSENQKEIYETIQECIKAVEEQPTAYDTNKVIKRIEFIKENGACAREDCGHCKYFMTCWDGEMSDRLAIDKAIEIVKRGGRDEE